MSQPLTLRAVRKAPRLSLILGVIVTALLLVLPFCCTCCRPAIRWRSRPIG